MSHQLECGAKENILTRRKVAAEHNTLGYEHGVYLLSPLAGDSKPPS